MNSVKRFLIILSILIGINESYAQSLPAPDLNKSLIPPAPEAASLGKYGIIPVTLYEGMPNTSVPVYEIKSGKLSLSITLGYNYNGFTPGVEASWVGLGWSLQASGVITRIVKGQADEAFNVENRWEDYANILDLAMDQGFLQKVTEGRADSEPDIYIFNFNGHSGKFIMVGERAFTFPHQDLLITRVGNGFRIVAEDGVTYNFYTTELTTPHNTMGGIYTFPFISAWDLTNIISADRTDTIRFQYADWGHMQFNNNSSQTYHQQVGGTLGGSACLGINGSCDSWSVNTTSGGSVGAKRLTSISSKNTVVNFIPENTQRQDLNSSSAFALKEIIVYSLPDTVMVRKLELVHEYFSYNAQLKLKALNLTGYYGGNTSANPNISLPEYYTFEYANETTGGFPKNTTGIDKWGYYNGKDGNVMLFDADFLGYTPVQAPGDRSVDATKSINGTLTKITYPTGGYSTFEYEANQIRIPNQSAYEQNLHTSANVNYDGIHNPTMGGGTFYLNEPQDINITVFRTIPTSWVHNWNPILKIYSFIPGDDGDPPTPPVYTLLYTCPIIGPADTLRTFTFGLDTGLYAYHVFCGSEAINSGATIDYKKLITPPQGVTEPGPGVRIREIKSYDSVHLNIPALTKTYSYSPAINISLSPWYDVATIQHEACGGNYDENVYSTNYSSPLATLISNQFYYPTVTEINHDSVGSGKTVYEYAGDSFSALGVTLLKQTDYAFDQSNNNAGILLKQKTNTYTERPGINFWGFTNQLVHINDASNSCWLPPLQSTDILDPISRFKIYHATAYAFTSDCWQLTATDEISNEPDGTNPMTIHTDYYYDNRNYVQPSRTVVNNSKGEAITTQTKYPYDCGANPLIISPCNFPGWQEDAFKIKRDEASMAYQNCMEARYNECFPYWIPGTQNSFNPILLSHLSNYHCPENYPAQFSSALSSIPYMPCSAQSGYIDVGVGAMQVYHIVNTPVEQILSITRSGNDYLFAANRTEFTTNGGATVSPKTLFQTKLNSTNILRSDYLTSPTNYLEARVNFVSDANNNIVEQSKANDVKTAYIYDYKKTHAIAQCINADKDNIAYTSFEANGKGRFNFSGTIITPSSPPPTGKKAYQLTSNNPITINVDAAKVYTVSLWATNNSVTVNNNIPLKIGRTIGGWTCYEYDVNNASTVTISGNTTIDELRLYPKESLMTTSTYDVLVGMTSQCDPNNHISYYEYDALGRLLLIRNEDRNIIKQYQYNYDRWPVTNLPEWVSTGTTQCKPCPANSNYLSNILQQQEHDINPQSPTYNQYRWVDLGPNQICDANASWENSEAPYCQLDENNQNTGNQVQVQTDMNPCSLTYGQTRQVLLYNPIVCPIGPVCTDCTEEGYKCILGNCELGTRVNTSSVFNYKTGMWTCTYHYNWTDGSHSQDYTETSTETCIKDDGAGGWGGSEAAGGCGN